MLPVTFGSLLGKYLIAYQGHTEEELNLLGKVQEWISQVPLDELIDEYNKLTVRRLWNSPLIATFSDSLLDRMKDTSFLLSVSQDLVYAQIGFRDSYFIPHSEGSVVSLTSLDLTEQQGLSIRRMLLEPMSVTLIISPLSIQKIYSTNDPLQHITLRKATEATETTNLQVEILYLDGVERIQEAIQGIRHNFANGPI